ncbi:MAG: TPM domain-containing protein [Thermodesulfobacteriota bacterium]|jgi:uncharacterized membrane protein
MFFKRHPKKFFTEDEQKRIVEEIHKAEERTSGEIRVHLDRHSGEDVLKKAQKIFYQLGMARTKDRNGVLIYLATDHRKFAIVGDEGIHRVVPENYWEEVKEEMRKHFREEKFFAGLCRAIQQIGEKLQAHFPAEKAGANELPDEISEEE